MEKSRLAFDSDENTEGGEEVASEVKSPAGGPKGNPHDYIDENQQVDGEPLDKNNPDHLARMHEDAKKQEPLKDSGQLSGVVEHEGHSAGIYSTEAGHEVRGKGSAAYIKSEPIADREHAEDFAKEMLKAHAKMSEREIVSRNTNLSETAETRFDAMTPKEKRNMWDSLTRGSTHKISACMNKVDGHVDNPGAYCKSLADEVGYKPM